MRKGKSVYKASDLGLGTTGGWREGLARQICDYESTREKEGRDVISQVHMLTSKVETVAETSALPNTKDQGGA